MSKANWFDGIRSDLAKRLPVYISDWTDIYSWKILSSSVFIFFTSISPALTFSLYVADTTERNLGAIEILFSTALTGVIYSILAGQPLNIIGVTGPVAILTAGIYTLSNFMGINFFPFFAWSQIWAGLMHIIFSCGNCCSLLQYVTEFSCDIFGVLVALIYLCTGVQGLVEMLSFKTCSIPTGLFQFIIAVGTVLLSLYLSDARSWKIFNEKFRSLIGDYGATVSIVIWSLVAIVSRSRMHGAIDDIPTLFVPLKFETSNGRGWFVDLSDIPIWAIFLAILPGIVITVLFFFDHNIGSIMAQNRDFGLKKSSAFHWDFAVIGLCIIATGILGIPPTNSLIPQSPMHVKSLTVKHRIYDANGKLTNEFQIEHIYENRVTNLLQAILTGIACLSPFSPILRQIPTAVLVGLFMFLGFQSFEDNEFFVRCQLFVLDKHQYHELSPAIVELLNTVPMDVILRFTIMQMCLCLIIFAATFTEVGAIFPVLLSVLAAIRKFVYPQLFSAKQLQLLDRPMLGAEEVYALAHPHEQVYQSTDKGGNNTIPERRKSYVPPPRKYSYL